MRQPRVKVKALRAATRAGDALAARELLAHSVASGHDRLSVRRYFIARALGAPDLEPFRGFCQATAMRMTADALLASASNASENAGTKKGVHEMAVELLPPTLPLVLAFDRVRPRFTGDPTFSGTGACVLGKVEIGARAFLSAGTVIRADGHFVRIGDDFCIGENATVHIAHALYPTIVGDRVIAARNTVIHACIVGDDCVIEDDVVILDGSEIAGDVVIEPGSVVFPRSNLASGYLYGGSPAKPIRELTPGERAERADRLRESIAGAAFAPGNRSASRQIERQPAAFVAANAHVSDAVRLGRGSSVFFGCRLEAGLFAITVGEHTNIQDNTEIVCHSGDVSIGAATTIGHNVLMQDCHVGNTALVGIGCVLRSGTVVEDDTFLAAGAVTLAGQRLETGWLWGGRPARPLVRLDDAKRTMMRQIITHYRGYADAYQQEQDETAMRRME